MILRNRYSLVRVLETSERGTRYEARDRLKNDQSVALETLRLPGSGSAFLSYYQAIWLKFSNLKHPGILTPTDFGILGQEAATGSPSVEKPAVGEDASDLTPDEEEVFFHVTPLLENPQNLYDAARGADPDRIVRWGIQICEALEFIHSRGLVTLSLDATKIFLIETENGKEQILLTDLALDAVPTGARTCHGRTAPTYAVPEVLLGRRVDDRADLYLLGVLFYHLLVRRPPFRDPSPEVTFNQHIERAPRVPPKKRGEIPDPLHEILMRLLEKHPKDRYRRVHDVALELAEFARPESSLWEPVRLPLRVPPLVGREREQSRLEALFAPQANQPPIVLIEGPTGLGKSRLLMHTAALFRGRGGRFLSGNCQEMKHALLGPLVPIAEEIASHKSIPTHLRPPLAQISPSIDLGDLERDPPLPPGEERIRIVDAIASALIEIARHESVLIHIEDLHHAPPFALGAVRLFLARIASEGGPRIAVSTYSADRLDTTTCSLLQSLETQEKLERISLTPLDPTGVSQQISGLLGMKKAPNRFGKRVYEVTGGIPIFVSEIVRNMVRDEDLFFEEGSWLINAPDPSTMKLPESLDAVVSCRLERLSPAARRLLTVLGVISRPIGLELASRAAGSSPPDTLESLLELLTAGLVEWRLDPDGVQIRITHPIYSRHALTRAGESISQEIASRAEKAFLFEKIQSSLGSGPNERVLPEEIARLSHNPQYLVQAAIRAEELGDRPTAIGFVHSALDTTDPENREKRISLSNRLGRLHRQQGDLQEALAAHETALSLSRREDLDHQQEEIQEAFLGIAYCTGFIRGTHLGLKILDEALNLLGQREGPIFRGRILFLKGTLFAQSGEYEKSTPIFEEGLSQLIKACNLDADPALYWKQVADPNFYEHHPSPGSHFEQALKICRQAGDLLGQRRIRIAMGEVLLRTAHFKRSMEEFRRAIVLADDTGNRHARIHGLLCMARAQLQAGILPGAQETHKRILRETVGLEGELETELAMLAGQEALTRKDLEEAEAHLRPILDRSPAPASATLLLAETYLAVGETGEANDLLEAVLPDTVQIYSWADRARYWLLRTSSTLSSEDRKRFSEELRESLAVCTRFEARGLLWRIEFLLALILEQDGETEQALGYCKNAFKTLNEIAQGVPEEHQEAFFELSGRRDLKRGLKKLQNRIGSARQVSESSIIGLRATHPSEESLSETPEPDIQELSEMEQAVQEYREEIKVLNLNLLRDEVNTLQKLLEINKKINTEHHLAHLLEIIIDTAIELSKAERGFLILTENEEIQFRIARSFEKEEIKDPEERISMSIAESVLSDGEAVLTTNAQKDQRLYKYQSVTDLALHSVLCVPLKLRDTVLGCLYIDNRFESGVFTNNEKKLLEVFADQASLAIHNARLFEENTQKNEELLRSQERIESMNQQLQTHNIGLVEQVDKTSTELAQAQSILKVQLTELEQKFSYHNIIGKSESMQEVFRLLDKVKESDIPVFIHGESGTGKELVAKAIHYNGARKEENFVSENCAAISETLLESEMFGYVKGAFTGADQDRKGLFEVANNGTLFLDEVGEMSTSMQKKLLRVLQEGEIRRVGGKNLISVNVRILSASNKNLQTLVESGEFRADLYYRLNVLTIHLPPLRDRREDIDLLIDHLLESLAIELGKKPRKLTRSARDLLLKHSWPGNIRELRNAITGAISLADGEWIDAENFQHEFGTAPPSAPSSLFGEELSIEDYTKRFIQVHQQNYNDTEIARILGVSRKTLWEKRKKWKIARD